LIKVSPFLPLLHARVFSFYFRIENLARSSVFSSVARPSLLRSFFRVKRDLFILPLFPLFFLASPTTTTRCPPRPRTSFPHSLFSFFLFVLPFCYDTFSQRPSGIFPGFDLTGLSFPIRLFLELGGREPQSILGSFLSPKPFPPPPGYFPSPPR